MKYLPFLSSVHALVRPDRYLEIGIRNGVSLSLANCKVVGIDPAYNLTAEVDNHVSLFRTTSDEYFSRPEPLAVTGGEPFDMAFIDGMHLFEFALRDFINTEKHARSSSVVIFDDVLPRNVDEAARDRHTIGWTGDVFRVIEVLARYRPEVVTILVDTQPTGLFIVAGLDPTSSVLEDHYDEIMAEFRRPDPQPVPQDILDRAAVQPPHRVLGATFWKVIAEERSDPAPQEFHSRLREQLTVDFGDAYARS